MHMPEPAQKMNRGLKKMLRFKMNNNGINKAPVPDFLMDSLIMVAM